MCVPRGRFRRRRSLGEQRHQSHHLRRHCHVSRAACPPCPPPAAAPQRRRPRSRGVGRQCSVRVCAEEMTVPAPRHHRELPRACGGVGLPKGSLPSPLRWHARGRHLLFHVVSLAFVSAVSTPPACAPRRAVPCGVAASSWRRVLIHTRGTRPLLAVALHLRHLHRRLQEAPLPLPPCVQDMRGVARWMQRRLPATVAAHRCHRHCRGLQRLYLDAHDLPPSPLVPAGGRTPDCLA